MSSYETDMFGGEADSFADRAPPKTTQVTKSPRVRKVLAPVQEIFKRPVYLCPELGRTCTRPGAYDAYDLPSMYAGVRKPYRFAE